MTIQEKLIDNKPRETSGSRSANRFDYQKDWALCKALELQLEEDNYVIVLDFHDDILILDSDISPDKIGFYQIKSKRSGVWTKATLIKRETDKMSILGKLLYNYTVFGDFDISLNLVSNATFDMKLADKTKSTEKISISLEELDEKEKVGIFKKVEEELNVNLKDKANLTYLRVTELGASGHDTYTKGKLVEFFSKYENGKYDVNANAAYGILFSEFKKKNDYEWEVGSFEEILKYKAVTRADFEKLINLLIKSSKQYTEWKDVEQELSSNGIGFKEISRIKKKWVDYELQRLDASNEIVQELQNDICKLINDEEDAAYIKMMYSIFSKYSLNNGYPYKIIGIDDAYVKAAILLELKSWSPDDE